MVGRGLEPGLVIINKPQDSIVKIDSFGNGWIKVYMSDGQLYLRSGGTISWRYNNPGNLKYGKFAAGNGAVGPGWGNHSVFPSYDIGAMAKRTLLFSPHKKYHDMTILEALSYYAPTSDGNNPSKYARYVAGEIGVSIHTKLINLSESQQTAMLTYMKIYEGFKVGKVEKI